jgi:hypothetical protein
MSPNKALLGELALVAMALLVEAQGNGNFGIDENGANEGGNEIGQLLLARLIKRQHGFRPELFDHRADQAFEHHGMPGDLPARIEPHLAFGIRQHLDALGIEAVEACVSQHAPMRRLEVVQPVDLAVAGEMARGIRKGLEALKQVAQRELDFCSERLAMLAQDVGLVFIKPGKTQALQQAACLSFPGLIWRCFLPQRFSPVRSSLETVWLSEVSFRKSNSCCMAACLGTACDASIQRIFQRSDAQACRLAGRHVETAAMPAGHGVRPLRSQEISGESAYRIRTGSSVRRHALPGSRFPTPTCTTMFMVNSLLEG